MATLGGEHPPTLQANPVPGDAPPEVRPELEKNGDASHTSPSGSLDGNEGKKEAPPEAPQRSKGKVALIMLALCVIDTIGLFVIF